MVGSRPCARSPEDLTAPPLVMMVAIEPQRAWAVHADGGLVSRLASHRSRLWASAFASA